MATGARLGYSGTVTCWAINLIFIILNILLDCSAMNASPPLDDYVDSEPETESPAASISKEKVDDMLRDEEEDGEAMDTGDEDGEKRQV
jgi:hypothetical protein